MPPHSLLVASALSAAPVAAEAEKPPEPVTLTVDIEAVSDYRFRGISLSGGDPAPQGGATLTLDPGIYASVWGSTIAETEGGADVELQLSLGYATEVLSGLEIDLALNYYAYPSDAGINYLESSAELSYALGPLTPKLGVQYAPPQAHLRDEAGAKRDNLYAWLGIDLLVGGIPVTLSGRAGYETGLFDTRVRGGKWDWSLGGKVTTKWFDFGLLYIDSNGRLRDRRGRNLAGETLVASLGRSF